MNKDFYLLENGTNKGPFSFDELKQQKIATDTLVWYEGLQDWSMAKNIPELKPLFVVPPPPPKPTPPPPPANIQPTKSNKSAFKYILYTLGAIVVFVLFIVITISLKNRVSTPTETSSNGLQELQTGLANLEQDQAQKQAQQKAQAEAQALHDLTLHNRKYRNNWESYIQVIPNYKDVFLGVEDVSITIKNLTEYDIENIGVNVNYIKANGNISKTEFVSTFVPANNSVVVQLPSSGQGAKITTDITTIVMPKMNFSYPMINSNPEDPWFYKFP